MPVGQHEKDIIKAGCILILAYWTINNLTVIGEVFKTILGFLSPFITGGVIAFILSVPMNNIERHLFQGKKNKKFNKLRRIFSYLITIFFLVLIIMLFSLVVFPQMTIAVKKLIKETPIAFEKLLNYLKSKGIDFPTISKQLNEMDIKENEIAGKTFNILRYGADVMGNIISGISTFTIGFIISIYFLFQKEDIKLKLKKVLFAFVSKKTASKTISLLKLAYSIFANFLSGQCLEALILGTIFCITMLILKLPYAFLIGTVIALTALIPVAGAFIGCLIGVILIGITSPMKVIIFVVMFLIVQQIENQLIYPHVVGKSVGLPGLWVFVALIIGGKMFGAIGMLVCIPFFSLLYCLFKDLINKRLEKNNIKFEED